MEILELLIGGALGAVASALGAQLQARSGAKLQRDGKVDEAKLAVYAEANEHVRFDEQWLDRVTDADPRYLGQRPARRGSDRVPISARLDLFASDTVLDAWRRYVHAEDCLARCVEDGDLDPRSGIDNSEKVVVDLREAMSRLHEAIASDINTMKAAPRRARMRLTSRLRVTRAATVVQPRRRLDP